MNQTLGYALESATTRLRMVKIKILYCGVCHADIHIARNEWNANMYPVVPAHEIVGKVIIATKTYPKILYYTASTFTAF